MKLYEDEFEYFKTEFAGAVARDEVYIMNNPELARAYYEEFRKEVPELRMYEDDRTQYLVVTKEQQLELLKHLQSLRERHEIALRDISLMMSAVMVDMM